MRSGNFHRKFRQRASRALLGVAIAGALLLGTAGAASAAQPDLGCKLHYSLKGWSVFYERANGYGTVTCRNGQSMPVVIRVRGGGLTAGKWQIDDGTGTFSDVFNIHDVLGSYAAASANAGVVRSAGAQVLTKGPVSLALAGTGRGVNIGIAGTRFEILAGR